MDSAGRVERIVLLIDDVLASEMNCEAVRFAVVPLGCYNRKEGRMVLSIHFLSLIASNVLFCEGIVYSKHCVVSIKR